MQKRSASQRATSANNGKRGKGPISPKGKQKSSKNARKHGLMENADTLKKSLLTELAPLRVKLVSRFDVSDPATAVLIDRVLLSSARLSRARELITEFLEHLVQQKGKPGPQVGLIDIGLKGAQSPLGSISINQLICYAQRFRGERDGALKKLERQRLEREEE